METTDAKTVTPAQALVDIKHTLELRLAQAVVELDRRIKKGTLSDIQRMYGFCLGVKSAIQEINALLGEDKYNFAGAEFFDQLLKDGFGEKTKNQIQTYTLPSFK